MNTTTANTINAFEKAAPLSTKALQGSYRGKVLTLPGFDRWPDWLYGLILGLVNHPFLNFVWKGKYFNSGQGSNLWFTCKPRFTFASYDYCQKQNSVELDYSVDRNPKPARKFSAILRQSCENENLIGEAFINGKHALFFSLEKVDNHAL